MELTEEQLDALYESLFDAEKLGNTAAIEKIYRRCLQYSNGHALAELAKELM
jgi:hypothetical protein